MKNGSALPLVLCLVILALTFGYFITLKQEIRNVIPTEESPQGLQLRPEGLTQGFQSSSAGPHSPGNGSYSGVELPSE
jgi:hypothetical protein